MKLYGYQNENGKISQKEIEVEERVVLIPKSGDSFPFIYGKQINREDVGEIIGYYPTIFLKESNFEFAKEKFLQKARETLSEKENARERALKDVEDFKKELEALEKESENSDGVTEQC